MIRKIYVMTSLIMHSAFCANNHNAVSDTLEDTGAVHIRPGAEYKDALYTRPAQPSAYSYADPLHASHSYSAELETEDIPKGFWARTKNNMHHWWNNTSKKQKCKHVVIIVGGTATILMLSRAEAWIIWFALSMISSHPEAVQSATANALAATASGLSAITPSQADIISTALTGATAGIATTTLSPSHSQTPNLEPSPSAPTQAPQTEPYSAECDLEDVKIFQRQNVAEEDRACFQHGKDHPCFQHTEHSCAEKDGLAYLQAEVTNSGQTVFHGPNNTQCTCPRICQKLPKFSCPCKTERGLPCDDIPPCHSECPLLMYPVCQSSCPNKPDPPSSFLGVCSWLRQKGFVSQTYGWAHNFCSRIFADKNA